MANVTVVPFDAGDVVQVLYDNGSVEERVVRYINVKTNKMLTTKINGHDYEWSDIYLHKLFPNHASKYIVTNLSVDDNKTNNVYKWNVALKNKTKGIIYVFLFNKRHKMHSPKQTIISFLQRKHSYSLQKQIEMNKIENLKFNKMKTNFKSKYASVIMCGYIHQSNVIIPTDLILLLVLYYGPLYHSNLVLKYRRNKQMELFNDEFNVIKAELFGAVFAANQLILKNTQLQYTSTCHQDDNYQKFKSLFGRYSVQIKQMIKNVNAADPTMFKIKKKLDRINREMTKTNTKQKQIIDYENNLNTQKKFTLNKTWNKYGYLLYDGYNDCCDEDDLEIILDKNNGVITCNDIVKYENIDKNQQYELQLMMFTKKH